MLSKEEELLMYDKKRQFIDMVAIVYKTDSEYNITDMEYQRDENRNFERVVVNMKDGKTAWFSVTGSNERGMMKDFHKFLRRLQEGELRDFEYIN